MKLKYYNFEKYLGESIVEHKDQVLSLCVIYEDGKPSNLVSGALDSTIIFWNLHEERK